MPPQPYRPHTQFVNLLSEALRQYRREHQITQAQFGAQLGVARTSVYDLEKGSTLPRMSTLRAIAKLLEWSFFDAGQVVLEMPHEPNIYSHGQGPDGQGAVRVQNRQQTDPGPDVRANGDQPHGFVADDARQAIQSADPEENR